MPRIEAREKVTGAARYAAEYRLPGMTYAWVVPAAVPRGLVRAVDATAALATPGVLAVLSHDGGGRNAAPRLRPQAPELALLQGPEIAYRGQPVAMVVAETPEGAREAAAAVEVRYQPEPHHVLLSRDEPDSYVPDTVNAGYPGTVETGDVDAALAQSPVVVDVTYTTPPQHAAPMEPHSATAAWEGGTLTVYHSDQAPWRTAVTLAELFGVPTEDVHVIADHVGGGFGSKAMVRPPTVLAALAARAVGRPVRLAVTRQQMFTLVSYRTPTVQRLRLGAGRDGRLRAVWHEALQQSSRLTEYCEQTVTPTRVMYATPSLRTVHRLARLDVPTPSWMRAPGKTPGMFALECAMDELAHALRMDPVELRLRNEPDLEPGSGTPFSSRNLTGCLREGAARFGWADRDPAPGPHRAGRWLRGTGVAAAMYPGYLRPCTATARAEPGGRFTVRVAGVDIGTGARTALTQLAAEALGVPPDGVTVEIGHSAYGPAPAAGGSAGLASWGTAVHRACRALLGRLAAAGGEVPEGGIEERAGTGEDIESRPELSRHSYGAQFAEVAVHAVTGEVRLERMLGVFAAGRIVNPRTARSQLLGGMCMGLSGALHEGLEVDPRDGDFANHDLATYHVASHADFRGAEVVLLEDEDPGLNEIGVKGIGELGIVGAAAAVANAVHHATGVRVRDLPIHPEDLRTPAGG
ncbi:xanthine dehydrogenase family protein molybdopterin-binding subunit [Streptomyces hoynatensis]|uniref:Xanthine dehydrogenase family protein molybdopterin-binding subunit n=1 Tax=Streptomyces hoynatensis TaxID=1141874 RepID=A0A3A9Z766_9ACTN|nr:xanthine dehydrogenase family protein molybdopterin-binding subunit [Streptomyces hoynatensis]